MTKMELAPARLFAVALGCSLLAVVVVGYAVTLQKVENERAVPTARPGPLPASSDLPEFDPIR